MYGSSRFPNPVIYPIKDNKEVLSDKKNSKGKAAILY
jgi:hypothetical protein